MGPAGGVIYPEQMADGQQLGTAHSLVSHLSQCTNVNYQKLTADWIQIWALLPSTQGHSQTPSNTECSLWCGLKRQHFCSQDLSKNVNVTNGHIHTTSGLICIYWFMFLETSVFSCQDKRNLNGMLRC